MRAATLTALSCLLGAGWALKCDNGREVPDAYIGDDYCDCVDGADEVTTGACTDSKFVCQNKPNEPTAIFASRVNDGVCDCCDGSDEWKFPSSCRNTCVDGAKAAMEDLIAALMAKSERSRRGSDAAVERAREIREARVSIGANNRAMRTAVGRGGAARDGPANPRETRRVHRGRHTPERERNCPAPRAPCTRRWATASPAGASAR